MESVVPPSGGPPSGLGKQQLPLQKKPPGHEFQRSQLIPEGQAGAAPQQSPG